MSICNICNQEMLTAASCEHLPVCGLDAIRFGEECDVFVNGEQVAQKPASAEKCRDCGVSQGGYHHRGCCVEQCPVCWQQVFCCGCLDADMLLSLSFGSFKDNFDYEGAIILLEGKRDVVPELQEKLTALGAKLCREMKHAKFRSGNASGADEYFSKGVASVDAGRLEVITPFDNHRKAKNSAQTTYPLDAIDLVQEPEVVYQTRANKKMEKLVDSYVQGVNNRVTIKAAYLLRDTVKVIGAQSSGIPATDFAIFYDDLSAPRQGGTGHTMGICDANNVPFVNQEVWLKWLDN